MNAPDQLLDTLLALANHYPSPHNGQPVRLRLIDAGPDATAVAEPGDATPLATQTSASLELYFERERGLSAADVSYIFSFVSMGVFTEHLALAAHALGHGFDYDLQLPAEADLHGSGPIRFGHCRVSWNAGQPDPALAQTLATRQTSRKKYSSGVADADAAALIGLVGDDGFNLTRLSRSAAHQAIWLNQRAVFDDMFDEPVRRELDHWLRYSQAQKQAARDGLAYDCMELNGPVMKYIVAHPGVLRAPGVSRVLKWYYLRTMADASDVFYMLAPFGDGLAAFRAGQTIMRAWTALAAQGYYLHPFGTIMSNHAAHQDFVRLSGITDESRRDNYLVFIFRAGRSAPPVPSLRLPYQDHLMMKRDI